MPAEKNSNGLWDWKSPHKSWMEGPKNLTEKEAAYLTMIEQIFRIRGASGDPIKYELTNHQAWFHLYDFSLRKGGSKIKIVIKSRNTSFTVSSEISLLMSLSEIHNPITPLVRLNASRAIALVSEFKEMIKLMRPIEVGGEKFPFDNDKVKMGSAQSITLPGGNQLVAFPANSDSSESIRGIRTHFGFDDESNFMRKFPDLFTANRKASYGTDENGEELFQMIIGTTLKGYTPFFEWYSNIEKKSKPIKENPYIKEVDNFVIFDWPIFERTVFEKYYKGEPENEIPFYENDELVSLVPWQTKEMLWQDYRHDTRVFMEENMAVQVDSDEQFYSLNLILGSIFEKLTIDIDEWEKSLNMAYKQVRIGIDVASINDYFVITCFGLTIEGYWEQFYLTYKNKVELAEMEIEVKGILRQLDRIGMDWECGIDANGIGLMITQNLQREFGDHRIRGIKGGNIKDADGNSHRLNEYGHTKLKRMMVDAKIKFLQDELLIKHFSMWDYNFKAESGIDGHGDITMACLYAMIYDEGSTTGEGRLYSSIEGGKNKDQNVWYMSAFKKRLSGKRGRQL